jgi:predicted GNAT superfamily acetyltransferase
MSSNHPTEQADQLLAALNNHAQAVCSWFEASKISDVAGRRAAAEAIGKSARICIRLGVDPYLESVA